MIIVRDVFQLKFGMAKEAIALMKQMSPVMKEMAYSKPVVMTDLTGPSYTMVMQTEHTDLGSFEKEMAAIFGNAEWESWYQKFKPLCQSASREIYRKVDV